MMIHSFRAVEFDSFVSVVHREMMMSRDVEELSFSFARAFSIPSRAFGEMSEVALVSRAPRVVFTK